VIVLREETGPLERLRPLAQAVAALSRAAFLGVVSQPPGVLVATSEDSGIGAKELLQPELSRVGGRGGGTDRLAQGTVPDAAAAERVRAALEGGV
jgi:alanyl-tRNA synthetase